MTDEVAVPMGAQETTGSAPGEESTELERFLAHMLNTSAEVSGDFASQVGAGLRPKPEEPDAPKERAMSAAETQFVAERTALEGLWRAVRRRSAEGRLGTASQLAELVTVPSHMGDDEFVTMAFEALEACREGRPFEGSGIPAPEDDEADGQEDLGDPVAAAAETAGDGTAGGADGVSAAQGEGPADKAAVGEEDAEDAAQWVEPAALEEAHAPLSCDDIVVIEGKADTSLYSRESMTDNFAHWAYLAAENDDLVTFVDNVREESRVYPRPMLAESFKNFPYRWDMERVEAAYGAVRESGEHPDIERVAATNGDVYFYSTDYLSHAQAKALAQWYSVEKPLNV